MENVILKLLKLLVCLCIFRVNLNVSAFGESNVTNILNGILKNGYDKRVRPNYGGPAVAVGVTMYIISVNSISDTNMDFTTTFYFRQKWNDTRLSFNSTNQTQYLVFGHEVAEAIWFPDTFFANEISAYFHTITAPNTFLRISSFGEVHKSNRLTITASCPMSLQYFPMDRQNCVLEIESYGYSADDIDLNWDNGLYSAGIADGLVLPQFEVIGHKIVKTTEVFNSGNYTRLMIEIHFNRWLGFYMTQFYIPAILIVVMSWSSFWLSRDSRTERVIIGVTTTLAIIGLIHSVQTIVPQMSYIKAIDVYLDFCFLMVFGSLLEYLIINYWSKRAFNENTSHQISESIRLKQVNDENGSVDEIVEKRFHNFGILNKLRGLSPSRVDWYSRIIYPIIFIVMNLIYWTYYLNNSGVIVEDLIPNY